MAVSLKTILTFLFIATFGECTSAQEYVPVVLWYGMGGNSHIKSAVKIKDTLAEELPGVYVTSVEFGKTNVENSLNSFFLNANTQVDEACKLVRDDPRLQGGFNAIGFSQGGQFLRALVQRCPEARVKTLITLGSPHQGVYGVPNCIPDTVFCDVTRRVFTWIASQGYIQDKIVQSQYWKDPLDEPSYLNFNTFLADINNERSKKNAAYARNLANLEKFVMVRFNRDQTVIPNESTWFGFYRPGQAKEVQPMKQTALYKEDWLGLRILEEKGSLHFLEVDSDHLGINWQWFKSTIINNYLR